jgi:DNA polymerase-3 subunit delta
MKHIVLMFGDDQFALSETVNRWKSAFIEKYGGDINLDMFEGKTAPNVIAEACQAMPFLGDKRLVFVKNFLSEQKADEQKKMAELLKEIPEETCTLIFTESKKPDKRTSLYKKLSKAARLEEFKPLVGDDLTRWIIKIVEEKKNSIDWSTAAYLSTLTGENTWKLQSEIQKLCDYSQGEPITRETVDELVHGDINTSIFKLTDALGQKNTKEVLGLFHQLVEKGEPIPMIYSMLVRQVRMLMQIFELSKLGKSPREIASLTKIHPYAVSQTLPQCRNYSLEELKTLFAKLSKIDLRLKTGGFTFSTTDQRPYMLEIEKFMVEATS